MTPAEFTLSAFVLALMFLGAWKLGELFFDASDRFATWRRDRRRTAGERLVLPGTRVVRMGGRR